MVERSRMPWVGCAWRPAPAFTTCSCGLTWLAMRNGAPEDACRTTKISACMAERLATVSRSDSPFVCEDTAMFRLMTSAERRLAAISNVVRVRVEGSKNRLKTLLPRRSGTFFTSRSVTPTNDSAVSRICARISRGSPSMERRCCSSPFSLSCGLRGTVRLQRERQATVRLALQAQPHARRHVKPCAAVLRANGQLPAAAVGEHDESDARRPAVIEQLVHRRAHRAAGIELVDSRYRQMKAAFELAREPLDTLGERVLAVGADRQTDHQLGRPPFADQLGNRIEAGRGDRRQRMRGAKLRLADGHSNAL